MVSAMRVLAFVSIFGGTFVLVSQVPSAQEFKMDMTGWGWVGYCASVVAVFVGHYLVSRWIAKQLGVLDQPSSTMRTFIEEFSKWLMVPLAAALAQMVLPSDIKFASPTGGCLIAAATGFALAVDTLVQRCITSWQVARLTSKTGHEPK